MDVEPSLKFHKYVKGESPPVTVPVKLTVKGTIPEVEFADALANGRLSVTFTVNEVVLVSPSPVPVMLTV